MGKVEKSPVIISSIQLWISWKLKDPRAQRGKINLLSTMDIQIVPLEADFCSIYSYAFSLQQLVLFTSTWHPLFDLNKLRSAIASAFIELNQ